jgi:iron complex outermembrane receptor protein
VRHAALRLQPLALGVALACSALGASVAQAQTATSSLAPVTITGSPVIEANVTDSFGAQRTTVGEQQIRDLNAIDLSSALRRSNGVTVSRFNPVGSFGGDEGGAVYVRGMGASRPGAEIRTYVDGVPFYMGVWNHPLLDFLPVHGVSEISVFKGPQPQTYGDSFAAIDLTPKRARRPGVSGEGSLSLGSYSTLVESAAVGWRSEQLDVLVSQGHAKSDGHRPDADGQLDNAMVNANLAIDSHWSVGLLALSAYNKVKDPGEDGLPATKTGTFTTRGSLAAVSLSHDHGAARGRLQVYSNSGQGLWDQPTVDVRSTFELSGLRWSETLTPWQGGEVVGGVDIERSNGTVAFDGFTAYPGTAIKLTQPHLAVAHRFNLASGATFTPSTGVRLYDSNVWGKVTAPHLGMVFEASPGLIFRAHQAKGTAYPGQGAPLLNAIVPPLAGATPQGWRDLKPEDMDHFEWGMRLSPSTGTVLDVALFRDRVKNRYVIAFPPAVSAPSLITLGSYDVRGAELSWQQTWSPALGSYAGFTALDATRDDLPYMPARSLSLGTTWRKGGWRLNVDAQAQAGMLTLNRGRGATDTNTRGVSGFAVVNAKLARDLVPGVEGFAAVENLGGRAYAYRPGYPMPERALQLGVTVKL